MRCSSISLMHRQYSWLRLTLAMRRRSSFPAADDLLDSTATKPLGSSPER